MAARRRTSARPRWWSSAPVSPACLPLMSSPSVAFGQSSWKPNPRSEAWQRHFKSMGHASSASITTGSRATSMSTQLVRELGLRRPYCLQVDADRDVLCQQDLPPFDPARCVAVSRPSVADRMRLGLTIFRAQRVRTGAKSIISVRQIGSAGSAERRVFRVVWEPLLRGKFGPHAEDVSAAWFWSKLRLAWRKPGCARRGTAGLFPRRLCSLADRARRRIAKSGGEVRLNTRALGPGDRERPCSRGGERSRAIQADAAILTPALPIIADLLRPHVSAGLCRANRCDRLSCECLRRSRADEKPFRALLDERQRSRFPFVGVIEHTNFDQADPTGRRHIVYLSRYLPASDPMFGASTDEVVRLRCHICSECFPIFDPAVHQAAHRLACALCPAVGGAQLQSAYSAAPNADTRRSSLRVWRRSIPRTGGPTTPFATDAGWRAWPLHYFRGWAQASLS